MRISDWSSDVCSSDLLNLFTGRRNLITHAPVRRAHFVVDTKGQTRFAKGADNSNASQLYYRDNDKAEWRLLNDENQSHRVETPLGFSADGRTAYLQIDCPQGRSEEQRLNSSH